MLAVPTRLDGPATGDEPEADGELSPAIMLLTPMEDIPEEVLLLTQVQNLTLLQALLMRWPALWKTGVAFVASVVSLLLVNSTLGRLRWHREVALCMLWNVLGFLLVLLVVGARTATHVETTVTDRRVVQSRLAAHRWWNAFQRADVTVLPLAAVESVAVVPPTAVQGLVRVGLADGSWTELLVADAHDFCRVLAALPLGPASYAVPAARGGSDDAGDDEGADGQGELLDDAVVDSGGPEGRVELHSAVAATLAAMVDADGGESVLFVSRPLVWERLRALWMARPVLALLWTLPWLMLGVLARRGVTWASKYFRLELTYVVTTHRALWLWRDGGAAEIRLGGPVRVYFDVDADGERPVGGRGSLFWPSVAARPGFPFDLAPAMACDRVPLARVMSALTLEPAADQDMHDVV